MKTRIAILVSMFCLAAASAFAGGHATIAVSELPKTLAAGNAVPVEFTIHDAVGRPMSQLKPVVVLERGSERKLFAAARSKQAGAYTAAVTFPDGGEWKLTVESNYCGNTCVLRGVKVAAAAAKKVTKT